MSRVDRGKTRKGYKITYRRQVDRIAWLNVKLKRVTTEMLQKFLQKSVPGGI